MKKRTLWRSILIVVLCCSMVLNVFAATTEETEIRENPDNTTSEISTTTTTTVEDGKTIVTVAINTETTGTNNNGQAVTGKETYESTTVTDENGRVLEYDWTEDGTEIKEWTEEDDGDASGQPKVSVDLNPGETTTGAAAETTVSGDEPRGENDRRYDYTETTKTDRTVTATTSTVQVKTNEHEADLESVRPDKYEGKYTEENHMYPDQKNEGKPVTGEAPAGADYQYIDDSDHGKFWVSKIMVNYLKDENDNTVYDENGNPVIEKLTKSDGTVMLDPETLEPSTDLEQMWKFYNEKTGRYEFALTGTRPTMFVLNNEEGDYVTAYCVDLVTGTESGEWYTVANLEDSDYYASEDAENHIRNIVLNGYWGTDIAADENGEYKTGSVSKIKEDLLAALANGEIKDEYEITYYPGMDATGAVNTGSEAVTVTVKLSDILDDLTEGEALAATQAAIWSYANGSKYTLNGEDGMVVANTQYGQIGRGNNYTPENAARVQAVYDWLVNLDEEQETTVIINEKNFVDNLTLSVGDKVQGAQTNLDADSANDIYNADLNFTLAFEPSSINDDLLLHISYTDLEGNEVSLTKRLAGTAAEGETFGTITPDENGVYTLEGMILSENENFAIDLRVEGTQYLEQGVYIYTPVDGRGASQSMVGIVEGTRTVDVAVGVSVSFNVEEDDQFRSERKWHREDPGYIWDDPYIPEDPEPTPDPVVPTPDPEEPTPDPVVPAPNPVNPVEDIPENDVPLEDIPDEDVPLVDIPDEEIPLAAVPQTGDASIYFAILSALSGTGLAGLALTKKRED